MDFREFLKNGIVCLDGGMGTLLQARGLTAGEHPEKWNISHPDVIKEIHKAYYDAGSNVVSTNTFGANILKFSEDELDDIIKAAIMNANAARSEASSTKERFIALDIGPTGKLLKPYGELDFETAVSVFKKTVEIGIKYGVDLVFIETMNDSYETKAALLAVKETSDIPVMVSNAYSEDHTLMTGATPEAMVAMLEGMGADAIGANCSLGPKQLRPVMERLLNAASVPVLFKPNAGLPKAINGRTVFDISVEGFSQEVALSVKNGVRIVGGCCGTTPEYIGALSERIKDVKPVPLKEKELTVISSYARAVKFDEAPVLIGERINPTGKKRFKQALIENDMGYILSEGVDQAEKGVHVLDVNVGLPDIDEKEMLVRAVCELQTVTELPLQIDTADPSTMEAALRRYNGKAMINSVNGKRESMESIFPLVKKYGGVVVALTLDENGIPETAEGRIDIAKKILKTASEYGISKKDIVFDTLALTVSADNKAANSTLEALKRIKTELGCHTSLGVSNVSFGLPNRDAINSIFFALALENGLSAAIMNPYSVDMMKTYYAYRALKGLDENCGEYILKADTFKTEAVNKVQEENKKNAEGLTELQYAVVKGFKEKAGEITKALLNEREPLDIINNEVIPALDMVGEGFEKKTVYLPQLLMSAEAAKSAFEQVKDFMKDSKNNESKGTLVLATVKGDIHDIGKNIVKLLLENYGYNVIDLGKDVPPERVVEAVIKHNASMAGLSALMTTTVPSMEETIKQLKNKAPRCKIIVGGAVMTEEYAKKINADKYAKDAMECVRYAEELTNK
jgi:5-methyltetrahydrofolate--homocysteine methyltransferase